MLLVASAESHTATREVAGEDFMEHMLEAHFLMAPRRCAQAHCGTGIATKLRAQSVYGLMTQTNAVEQQHVIDYDS